ncbi:MAG TPA: MoaD/ThiS family protein [Anaerolineae bacterium]|nr:MoaD/ThiS family protein [Anaerolineae bacterium]
MPQIKFTRHLIRFFPTLTGPTSATGNTIAAIITDLDQQYPGLATYIIDEHGRLRRHVNIFIQNELITDRQTLSDPVAPDDDIYIFQALSGG